MEPGRLLSGAERAILDIGHRLHDRMNMAHSDIYDPLQNALAALRIARSRIQHAPDCSENPFTFPTGGYGDCICSIAPEYPTTSQEIEDFWQDIGRVT
jgi:hypothetical protein